MFTKKPDANALQGANVLAPPARPAPLPPAGPTLPPAPQRSGNASASVGGAITGKPTASSIGPDLTIMGNLISKGEVVVDGEVQGDIACAHLTVGQMATITGGIVAEDVVVRGHVMGSIRGNRVNLQSTARVEGDVFHQSLAIEQGAMFEGRSRRSSPDEQVNAARNEAMRAPAQAMN